MSYYRLIYAVVLIAMVTGCKTISAPKGSVPKRKQLPLDAYGAWFSGRQSAQKMLVQGELIAIENDSIFILSADELKGIPAKEIDSAGVIVFNTEENTYAIWTGLLTAASLTTGYFAGLTLPLSLGVGIVTTRDEANRINSFDFPQNSWPTISKFARFPQGMPPGIDRKSIRRRNF